MTKRFILIATLSATLAACGPTREEILRQERQEAEQRARQEAEWNRLRSIKSKVKPKEAPFEVTFVDSNNGGAIIKVQSKHDQLIVQNIIVNRGELRRIGCGQRGMELQSNRTAGASIRRCQRRNIYFLPPDRNHR